MKIQIHHIALLLLCCSPVLFGLQQYQPTMSDPILEPWRWKHFQALSGKGVSCITSDIDGHMWFGVDQGIVHYDGYAWSSFSLGDSSETPVVSVLYTTENGDVLAGTDNGLYQFFEDKWDKIFPQQQTDVVAPVTAISELQDGSLVVAFGTRHASNSFAGLLQMQQNRYIFYGTSVTMNVLSRAQFQNLELNLVPGSISVHDENDPELFNVLDILTSQDNRLWVSVSSYTSRGKVAVFQQEKQDDGILNLQDFYTEKDGVDIRDYVRMAQTTDGKIWVISNAHESGVNCFDGQRWTCTRLSSEYGDNDSQYSLLAVADGSLWVDGRGKIFVHRNKTWQLYKPPDIPISSTARIIFYETDDGNLWIAGLKNEVYMLENTNRRWTRYLHLNFQCSAPDGSAWFIALDGRVVQQRGDTWLSYGSEDGLLDTPVRIITTSQGLVCVAGSHRGAAAVSFFDGLTWRTEQYPRLSWGIDYRSVYESKDGSLWFGCAVDIQPDRGHIGGVLRLLNPAEVPFTYKHYPDEDDFTKGIVYGIGESADGKVWIGGRPVMTVQDNTYALPDSPAVLKEYVDCMATSPSRMLWMGMRNYGVLRFDGTAWQHFTTDDGLESNTIISMTAPTDSSLWVATDKDICYFDGTSWTTTIFPAEMTMSREGGSIRFSDNGDLWINHSSRAWKRRALTGAGTLPEAYDDFWTINYQPDDRAPVARISVYSNEVSPHGNTTIFWDGDDYWETTPKNKIQFSYRLNDGPWSPYHLENYHTFLNLSPGKYQLDLRVRDLDFNAALEPASVQFHVMPPLWRQPLFLTLLALAFAVIAFLEIRILLRDRRLRLLNDELSDHTEQLENYSHTLEAQKRQIEEQRDQLSDMVQKVNELSHMRLRLFANISHEFRTPLTLILGPAEKLLDKTKRLKTNDRDKLSRIIQRNAHRLLRLINQILEIYKVEEGTLELDLQKNDLILFVREIYNVFHDLAQQRNIDFRLDSNVDSLFVLFDSDKIEKILFNLLSNSFKNTPASGSIKLDIDVDNEIKLMVTDNGRGIPPEQIDFIFDRFFQVHSENQTHQHTSSGIGLSYIKDLVKTHQGRIEVMSTPNVETSFVVRLPIFESSSESDADRSISRSVSHDLGPAVRELSRLLNESTTPAQNDQDNKDVSTSKSSILVIEDDEDVRLYLADSLSTNYNVALATNGQEGLQQVKKLQPELVISDVMMPVLDGLEFCRQLKSDFQISHIPVILLTARNLTGEKIVGLETGADDYIEKPFDINLLAARIENLITNRQQLRERFQREVQLQPQDIAMNSLDSQFLQKAIDIVHEQLDDSEFDAEVLSVRLGVSRVQLYRKMKALTGQTVHQFIKSIRLKYAARLITEKQLTISEAAYAVGFSEPSNFTTSFRQQFGLSPSEYLAHKKDLTI